jgi:hypothetical protein
MRKMNFFGCLLLATGMLVAPAGCSDDDKTDAPTTPITSITLGANDAELILVKDEPYQLSVTTEPVGSAVKFVSSDEAVCTVDGSGKITAKGTGSATITVTPYGDFTAPSAVCKVSVVTERISVTPGAYVVAVKAGSSVTRADSLREDSAANFQKFFVYSGSGTVEYEVEDETFAKIENGVLKEQGKKGVTQIRAVAKQNGAVVAVSPWIKLFASYNVKTNWYWKDDANADSATHPYRGSVYTADADYKVISLADSGCTVTAGSTNDGNANWSPTLVIDNRRFASETDFRWVSSPVNDANSSEWLLIDLKKKRDVYRFWFHKRSNTANVTFYVTDITTDNLQGNTTGEGFTKLGEFNFMTEQDIDPTRTPGDYTGSPQVTKDLYASTRYVLVVLSLNPSKVPNTIQMSQIDISTLY